MEKRRRRRRPATNTNTNTNSISLSLFGALTQSFSLDKTTAKSTPRTRRRSSFFFENGGSGGGGVGLGIVAAMSGSNNSQETTSPATKVTNLLPSPRSNPPISIASLAKPAANFKAGTTNIIGFERIVDESHDDDDDDESYTCVISHVGNDVIEKHVYYGFDNSNSNSNSNSNCNSNSDSMRIYDDRPALFYTSSSPTTTVTMNIRVGSQERREFWTSDFLSSCYLCNKPLHGLDIFMYRGEKAFCSVECRDKQIRSEDYKEKCGSEAGTAHDYSASPCTSPQVFFAGVAAA